MTPYLGQIMIAGFNFAPRGWAFCDGQLLPISQNSALFSLLGTIYGGDGRTTFALPDLRGRSPMHPGTTTVRGARFGAEAVALNTAQLPAHSHALRATGDLARTGDPTGALVAGRGRGSPVMHAAGGPATDMHPDSIGQAGNLQAHNNMQPSLTMNFVIALQGIFPSRS